MASLLNLSATRNSVILLHNAFITRKLISTTLKKYPRIRDFCIQPLGDAPIIQIFEWVAAALNASLISFESASRIEGMTPEIKRRLPKIGSRGVVKIGEDE